MKKNKQIKILGPDYALNVFGTTFSKNLIVFVFEFKCRLPFVF